MIRQGLKQAMTASTKRSMPTQAALLANNTLARSKCVIIDRLKSHVRQAKPFSLPYLLYYLFANRFQNVASPG